MTEMKTLHDPESSVKIKPIQIGLVYFDGVCGLCNRVVDFLMKNDHYGYFKYAPLQGKTAKEALSPEQLLTLDTIIYQEDNQIYKKSDAVIKILTRIGGFWKSMIVFRFIPTFIRDSVYDYIARKRYGWFGKRDSCRMPANEEREKILP
jgi:predicted DCC family thiol-disulfide oxidoreductase YuxK